MMRMKTMKFLRIKKHQNLQPLLRTITRANLSLINLRDRMNKILVTQMTLKRRPIYKRMNRS